MDAVEKEVANCVIPHIGDWLAFVTSREGGQWGDDVCIFGNKAGRLDKYTEGVAQLR